MTPIPAPATIGMLGGGQLGRMFTIAAKKMGYKVIVLDPDKESPACQVADGCIEAELDDSQKAVELAQKCDVITYEFENVSIEVIGEIRRHNKKIFPAANLLEISQHRIKEKDFVKSLGIAVTPYLKIKTAGDFIKLVNQISYPSIIKTARGGYDGKGQWVVKKYEDAKFAFAQASGKTLIYEKMVDFEKEISAICARNAKGDVAIYPICENSHENGILHMTVVPARISTKVEKKARQIIKKIAVALDVVGLFCVEMFVLKNGAILVNEIAPRPHNSGHYSIDACECSQFEQQARAVCNLELGSTKMVVDAAVMVNILGVGLGDNLVGTQEILKNKNVRLHMYGKKQAREGRKMGHFTILSDNLTNAIVLAQKIEKKLKWE